MDNHEAATIGENLRRAHRFSGVTFADLCAETGLTRACLCNYESGRRTPGSKTLLAYAKTTGVSVDALLQESHPIWSSIQAVLDHRDWLKEKRNRLESIDAALAQAERNLEYVWSPDGDY